MRYLIEIINEKVTEGDWGDFTVHKDFNVSYNSRMSNKKLIPKITKNKTKRNTNYCKRGTRKNTTNGINGYILQEVRKHTVAYVLCKNGLKKINDIAKFTDGNVKYMNDSYYELFPVLDGKACSGDNFQNGEILRYVIDNNTKKPGGDNNPPTRGTIKQTGKICFIPAPYMSVISTQLKMRKNIRTVKDTYITIFGIDWNINRLLPANGLPYSTSDAVIDLYNKSKSNTINHIVTVEWNGIFDYEINNKNNKINENNGNNGNIEINENNENNANNANNANKCKINNENEYDLTSNDRNKAAKSIVISNIEYL
jgi:hypothetical protein